ncbi:MAG: squalene synthase HpnC [Elusimicrobia bacterium]|nr:squalene synthase HpnC [Elusimicrobiota bacterium]
MTFSTDRLPPTVGSLTEAYQACERLTRSHYENFPVASLWLPRPLRTSIGAVYAFSRCADDFADELGLEPADRLARLADWRRRLFAMTRDHEKHPVFWALSDTLARHGLPLDPFDRLVTAFEMDVKKNRHSDWNDLLFYCRHSANPVGELVLRLFGLWTPERGRWSDAICTALQLANFWQDVTVDALKDRIYIPQNDMGEFQVSEASVLRGPATDALKQLMERQVTRTWTLFKEGFPLLRSVPFQLGVELKLVWLGGTEILRKIESQSHDVWARRPHVSKSDWARLFFRMIFGAPRLSSLAPCGGRV